MSTVAHYLIAGPAALREQANDAAATWDTIGGHLSFLPAMLGQVGADPAIPTHTAVHTRLLVEVAAVIERDLVPQFPGWVIIRCNDVEAALALAGLRRVVVAMP